MATFKGTCASCRWSTQQISQPSVNAIPGPARSLASARQVIHSSHAGGDLDIRTDVPRYRVFRDGRLTDEPTDIKELWRDDLVSFVLGCSFSFEQALIEAGVSLRHLECCKNVAMYKTNIDTVPAGRFGGKMVVSMRPLNPADAIRAIQSRHAFLTSMARHTRRPSGADRHRRSRATVRR